MNDIIQVIFSVRFALSAIVFVSLSLLISWLGLWLERRLHDAPFNAWLAEHIGIPLLSALAMILFIAILYPALFPLDALPGFYELLISEKGRMNQLINWVFVLSLMIPMIPVIGPRVEIVLPLQGLVVLALVTNWIGKYLQDPAISLLPSGMDFLWMLIWGVIGARLAVIISEKLGNQLDERLDLIHTAAYLHPILALILQTPTMVIYARGVIPV
jgi:hypothetical protein